jgi:hypothetical protein
MTRTPGPSCHQAAKRADAVPMSPQGIPATPKVTLPPSRHIEAEKVHHQAQPDGVRGGERPRNG